MHEKSEISVQLLRQVIKIEDGNFALEQSNEVIQWDEVYSFFCEHAIIALVKELINYIPEEYKVIKSEWKKSIYSTISINTHLVNRQEQILAAFRSARISVVVIKGTSAAKYYPEPHLRIMSDVDLLVKPEDYEDAVTCLRNIGCIEITNQYEAERGRHRSFHFKEIEIELHHFFSSKNMIENEANELDNLLYAAISPNHAELPDDENGLVLLSHIKQHFKEGVGLRQIIDWFMFVRACLDDEMWYSSFQKKASITGLEALAIIVTRMCQIHLGLTTESITWCKDADEVICDDLMKYVMECGNFGRSREMLQSQAVEKLPPISHPIRLLKHIQSHGETNWKALKKRPWLKPFAWIYQSFRYIKLAFQNEVTPNKLKSIYNEGNKRNEMFAALGLK